MKPTGRIASTQKTLKTDNETVENVSNLELLRASETSLRSESLIANSYRKYSLQS